MDLLNAIVALLNFVVIPATSYGAQLALVEGPPHPFQHHLGHDQDCVERGAQFVAHDGQEFILDLHRGSQLRIDPRQVAGALFDALLEVVMCLA